MSVPGSSLETRGLDREAVGVRHVVGVHPRDERAPDEGEAGVQGADEAVGPGGRRGDPHPRVGAGRRFQDLAAPVARAVVHRDDLVVRQALGGEGGQALAQNGRRVAHRKQDRDARHVSSSGG